MEIWSHRRNTISESIRSPPGMIYESPWPSQGMYRRPCMKNLGLAYNTVIVCCLYEVGNRGSPISQSSEGGAVRL